MIVAFLQNMWFPAASIPKIEAAFKRYAQTPEDRSDLIARYLFIRCLTGRRLQAAFGKWCDEIMWEESTTQIASEASGSFPPDPHHIHAVIGHFQPDTILTFGRIATDAVRKLMPPGARLISGPHPAARHASVMEELKRMADGLGSSRENEP